MGWLLELLFEAVRELCSQFIIDMMDIASGMFTEIYPATWTCLKNYLELWELCTRMQSCRLQLRCFS